VVREDDAVTQKVRITVLVENTAEKPDLLAEHGLSFCIEIGSQRILFDTGQGRVLAGNAFRLGVPLDEIDAVVLSHGHYDHTGGLADILRRNFAATFYAHPAALEPKFARDKDSTSREIGMQGASVEAIRRRRQPLVLTGKPTNVTDGLMVTGPVPRVTDFEDTGGPFFLDAGCQKPDPLGDDQAMFFASEQGTVVLSGCAHSGIVNTLRYIRELTDNRPIHAVLGGMHLVGASQERISRTLAEFRELAIDLVAPAHCTGRAATAALLSTMGDRCVACDVGTRFEFNLIRSFVTSPASS